MPSTTLIKVLQGLIHEQLNPVISLLTIKSQSPAHDKAFYTQFKEKIDNLDTKIKTFESKADDEADSKAIEKILETVKTESETLRKGAGKLEEEGRTMSCLDSLIKHTKKLHPKLKEFQLIDLEYKEDSPEGIVFFHAANYIGRGIFDPKKPTVGTTKRASIKGKACNVKILEV